MPSWTAKGIPITYKKNIPQHFLIGDFPFLRVNPDDLKDGVHKVAGLTQIISQYPEGTLNDMLDMICENIRRSSLSIIVVW